MRTFALATHYWSETDIMLEIIKADSEEDALLSCLRELEGYEKEYAKMLGEDFPSREGLSIDERFILLERTYDIKEVL